MWCPKPHAAKPTTRPPRWKNWPSYAGKRLEGAQKTGGHETQKSSVEKRLNSKKKTGEIKKRNYGAGKRIFNGEWSVGNEGLTHVPHIQLSLLNDLQHGTECHGFFAVFFQMAFLYRGACSSGIGLSGRATPTCIGRQTSGRNGRPKARKIRYSTNRPVAITSGMWFVCIHSRPFVGHLFVYADGYVINDHDFRFFYYTEHHGADTENHSISLG